MSEVAEPHEELLRIADSMNRLAEHGRSEMIQRPLERLKQAAEETGRASSGSWLGYHANVYYKDLRPPPPGMHFSQEWGLQDPLVGGSTGDWVEFDAEAVRTAIHNSAGNPDMTPAREFYADTAEKLDMLKSDLLSILEVELTDSSDGFLMRLKDDVTKLSVVTAIDVANDLKPGGQKITRDRIAHGQGQSIPPHCWVLSEVIAIQDAPDVVTDLAKLARRAGSHVARQRRRRQRTEIAGTKVFIGHGRSPAWRELKDFIEDRLQLPVDEFTRVSVAGVTNVKRLSEMLDAATVALIIMTGDDEQPDGQLHARMNVVHEAGLFQGRLGFGRTIVLLEDGCEEFSNIAGLGQIRFPTDNIKSAFEDIRKFLEREQILDDDAQ